MTVIGTGMLARALAGLPGAGAVIAAGVSDSACADPAAFAREAAVVARHLGPHAVYLSSTAAADPATPYTRHKAAMEAMVLGAGGLVVRLPNVVGPGQAAHQLVPALVRQIRAGLVRVFAGAVRDLVGAADVRGIVGELVADGRAGTVEVGTGHPPTAAEVVAELQVILGTGAVVVAGPPVANPPMPTYPWPAFGPGYWRRVLREYVGPEGCR